VEGCFRFLGRVFRLVDKNIELLKMDLRCGGEETKVVKDILYYTHSTIKKVTNDIENFSTILLLQLLWNLQITLWI